MTAIQFKIRIHSMLMINHGSRVDLPAQRRRTSLDVPAQHLLIEPFLTQRPHGTATMHTSGSGLGLGLGLDFRVGVVAAVSRSRK